MIIGGKAKEQMTYDAVVVGLGISRGWLAKEVAERGLKVLMLERGRMIEQWKMTQKCRFLINLINATP
ncbi:MAG: hypothetical protein ACK4YV_01900 [Emticicia sp.]